MFTFALASVVLGAVYFDGDGFFTYADVTQVPGDDPYLRLDDETKWRGSCWIAMHGDTLPPGQQVIMQMMSGDDDLGFQVRYTGNDMSHPYTFAVEVTSVTDNVTPVVFSATAYGDDDLVTADTMVDHDDDVRDEGWIHLAFHARYNQTASGDDKLRVALYVNGVQQTGASATASNGSSVEAAQRFDSTTSPALFVGGDGADDFKGEIADVGLSLDDWASDLVQDLYGTGKFIDEDLQNGDVGQSFGDVDPTTTVAFYAPLSLDEPFHDTVEPNVIAVASTNLTYHRTLGVPLSYDDALPTIMIVGDTQSIAGSDVISDVEDSRMYSMAQHIVDYESTFNIRTVFHVGDWANNWDPAANRHLVRNTTFLMRSLLFADIPFALTIGDHEFNAVKNWRQSRCFLDAMRSLEGPTGSQVRIEDEVFDTNNGWFVDNLSDSNGEPIEFEEDLYTYSYTFDIDGTTHLAIVVPYGASVAQLQWAVDEAAKYDDIPSSEDYMDVWIITHAWLAGSQMFPVRIDDSHGLESPSNIFKKSNNTNENCVCTAPPEPDCDGQLCTGVTVVCDTSALAVPLNPDSATGDEIWDDYFDEIPNLVGIICGHFSFNAAHRHDLAPENEKVQHCVWQLLVNSQKEQQEDLEPIDNGAIQILRFVDADTIDVTSWGLLTGEQRGPGDSVFEFEFDLGVCPQP